MSAPAGSYSQMGPSNTTNQTHITNPNVNQQTVPGGQFDPIFQNTNQVPSEGRIMDPSGTTNPNVHSGLSTGQNYNPSGTTNPNVDSNLSTGQGYNNTEGRRMDSSGMANSNAGQGYNQMPGREHHYYAPAESDQPAARTETGAASCGDTAGKGVHGVFKSIHGAGEALRGNVMSAIDNALGNKESAAKNSQIAQAGYQEMRTGGTAARGPKQANP
ncbi:hypothetical protein Clacol_005542 [Clathrus columnatus]|uniref:Uncharacterized protein n=1 Tax=Clathrus columnatus TaxID=1419009 RepID=A0AAV5AAF8_9AGAM|nr:hypothetical protein Clacol_005542 [Clathrus columnatus]